LAFADIRSPDTMRNLQSNPHVEINVIDPLSRKGYLFKGQARIIKDNALFEEILNHYRNKGVKRMFQAYLK
jgi:predicted pyridoxine 5'-phosphate oxidase superfamily flavin-nucleotide-binding protein